MNLSEALDKGETAFLALEAGTLDERSLTVYAVYETSGERVIERRKTAYEAIQPPRFLESPPQAWWVPGEGERERIEGVPDDVERSDGWEPSNTAPDALDVSGMDTAGKALNALRGLSPAKAALRDPEPPFTAEFEVVEEAAKIPPGQDPSTVEEGPPEITSRTQLLRELQAGE